MEKPIELVIEEFKQSLLEIINNAPLPHYIVLPILTEISGEYAKLSTAEKNKRINEYLNNVDK